MKSLHTAFLTIVITLSSAAIGHADWPQWRGPTAQGHAPEGTKLPTEWSEEKNVTWKTPLPGKGHSSPIIAGDHIWLTTAFETPAKPEDVERRLKKNTGGQPLTVLEEAKFHAVCVSAKSGEILHDIHLFSTKEPQWVHRLNSYASPTPIFEDGFLYCHFGSFGSACLDTATGKVKWVNQDLQVMHENGPGSSPVLYGDLMIFHLDGSDKQFIAALSKSTGTLEWKTERTGKMNANPQLKKAYGTPIIENIAGKDVLVSPAADWLYGYDPTTGDELWKVPYETLGFSNVARPVTGHGMIFLPTCFMKSEMLGIQYEGVKTPKIVWRYKKNAPKSPSPILVGDQLFAVSDQGGIVTCLDAKTGDEIYRERIKGNYSASPLHADGKIYFHSQEGNTVVVAAGKEFNVLAENKLDGSHLASAAVVGNALILRTDKALYRIEE